MTAGNDTKLPRGTVYSPSDKKGVWIRWQDADGRWRKRKVTEGRRAVDREVAREALKVEKERAQQIRLGLIDPEAEERLAAARTANVEQHLEAFETHLKTKRGKPKHVDLSLARLRAAIAGMKARALRDISCGRLESYLVRLIEQNGLSAKTRDEALAVVRRFVRWAIAQKLLVDDVTAGIPRLTNPMRVNPRATYRRRPLTVEELWALVDAAERRPVENYRARHPSAPPEKLDELLERGRQRGLAYLVMGYVGLRLGALRALRWADIRRNGQRIALRAEHAKDGDDDEPAAPPWLAERLMEHRARQARLRGGPVSESDKVFDDVPDKLVRRLRLDLEFAGIEEKTPAGRIDVHSLRVTAASLLVQSGAPVQAAQKQLGHSDVRITARIYARLKPDALDEAVAALPVPDGVRAGGGRRGRAAR
jgi:integrase